MTKHVFSVSSASECCLCYSPYVSLCSLVNMYKELATDIPGFQKPDHGHLVGWAKQGENYHIDIKDDFEDVCVSFVSLITTFFRGVIVKCVSNCRIWQGEFS